MKTLTLSLLILFQFSYVFAQTLAEKVDKAILAEFKDPSGPGGVFLIAKGGKVIYQKAFGKANVELGVPLTTANVFQIGSMTKQFTSVAVLILEEQGKLRVDDKVAKYVPDYPNGDAITLHHLLTHTSGIKDFNKMKTLRDIAQKEMNPKMMVDFFKNEPADFKPGEKFEYSNSGYILLGYIIELVSGETYEEFVRKRLFEKAGMNHSYYASDRQIIPKRAYGHHKKENGYVNKTVISYSIPFSAGSLMSTVEDLLKWQNALKNNLFLKKENLEKAFTYGYGWHIKEINGVPSREHGGSIFGYKSMGVYLPKEDIYVIGLSNCDCNSPTQLVRNIAVLVASPHLKGH